MSDWLAAYEAQKAAVMAKMNAPKAGQGTATTQSNSVSGSSEFSGLVNVSEVEHLSKTTQVTKLMNNLKKSGMVKSVYN